MSSENLYEVFTHTLKKSLSAKYVEYVIKVMTMMIYARIFAPEQFGIMAVLQVFIVFFMMLSDVGIGPAIINYKDLKNRDRDGLFTISILLGLFFSIVFYFSLFALNTFYGRTDYQTFGILICISVFFNAISSIPLNLLYKQKKFFKVMRAVVLSEILSLFVVLTLHFTFKVDALWIMASIPMSLSIVKFLSIMIMNKREELGRPTVGKHFSAIKPILSFSLYQFGFNILNYFSRNLDNILVGKYIGMNDLGVYGKSYELMRYPLQLLTFAFTPAIQPTIASSYNNPSLICKLHNNFAINILICGGYFGLIFHFISDDIVLFILGDKWADVAVLLMIFSYIVPVQVLLSSSGGFFQGMRKTNEMFKSGVFSSLTNVSSILIGIYYGDLELLAYCLVFSFTLNSLQCYYLLYKNVFNSTYVTFLSVLLFGLLPFIISFLSIYFFEIQPLYVENTFLRLIINAGGIAFIYIASLILIYPFKKVLIRKF
ncbi:oligosaccharide flippase family protein [Shewanella baltica]|uniref:oligosaccharide flippase family protein n=1 Tax=Shewanella baltica TaxID=62322 RepID=UPI000D35F60A|nr:oligosaccharide flippase family protein [Shewanella baltica]